MGDLFRVRSEWTGSAPGLPYLSTMYFGTALYVEQDCVDACRAFWNDGKSNFHSSLTVNIDPTVDIIDDATGTLVGVTGVIAPSAVTGTLAGDLLPTQTQGLIRLLTGSIVSGRLLRGHIYCPGADESMNIAGAPTGTYTGTWNTAISNLIADVGSELRVWSRKHGTSALATAGSTSNTWAVLRSRRD